MKKNKSVFHFNIKLKNFDEERIYYSLGFLIEKYGPYINFNQNGYIGKEDLGENFERLKNFDFEDYDGRLEILLDKYFGMKKRQHNKNIDEKFILQVQNRKKYILHYIY
ncbi:MAG: hypothetical protein NUV46_00160 [Nanoarchaeota archaeon]|nr:hypothetical protein [Nanoarchaeota archaeon]